MGKRGLSLLERLIILTPSPPPLRSCEPGIECGLPRAKGWLSEQATYGNLSSYFEDWDHNTRISHHAEEG